MSDMSEYLVSFTEAVLSEHLFFCLFLFFIIYLFYDVVILQLGCYFARTSLLILFGNENMNFSDDNNSTIPPLPC